MPHVIHRSQIPKTLRGRNERAYIRQLQRTLLDPSLSDEKRRALQGKLDRLTNKAPPGLPATSEGSDAPTSPEETGVDSPEGGLPEPLGEKALLRLRKAEILSTGQSEGAPVDDAMTKTELVDVIVEHRSSGESE